jgi:hypothetical protein
MVLEMMITSQRPTTKIPELWFNDLSDLQYRTVGQIVHYASELQEEELNPGGNATVRWRIELVSAFMAALLHHAKLAAIDNGDDPDTMQRLAIDLAVKRAKEILRQGSA